ncbi:DNA polymerase [Brachybacterium sp. UNK5269]|uniref:DNA polymerase n=1 Tax=Brachybacterium sp. UNK5269 TaxID=3408576 RepID=UPI003BAE74C1
MSIVFFDTETASADTLYTYGPGFLRLAAFAVDNGPVEVTTDMRELCTVLAWADVVVAHNGIGFDLAALEHWYGLDVGRLVHEGRVRDTLLLARQADPPLSGTSTGKAKRYDLDSVADRLGITGKLREGDGASVLKHLAREHGGYDQIPVDDPAYRAYAVQDVEVLREVAGRLPMDSYLIREHEVMWRLSHISRSGFRVDVEEARRRQAAQRARQDALKTEFRRRFGLPHTGQKPQASTAGKAAIERAMLEYGVEPPRTTRGGLATSRKALEDLRGEHPDNTPLDELCELVLSLNEERSIVDTILSCTGPDGRVHPQINAGQATGRISVTKPGLSVMGKRDRRNVLERSLLLPDEGEVLLAVDLSQVDARAVAAHCQDPAYIAMFAPGEDFHSRMAEKLFNDASRRDEAKPVTHASTYGMGARKLAEVIESTVEEAGAQLAQLNVAFPRLAWWKNHAHKNAERDGEVRSAFGRRIGVDPGHAYTQGPASLGQGTARDLMMEGVLRLPEWLLPCLRAIIHDEIVLSVPVDRLDEARAAVLAALQFDFTIMEGAITVPVLAAASDAGRDWADCYRSEKPKWPEVAREHRALPACGDTGCVWHGGLAP